MNQNNFFCPDKLRVNRTRAHKAFLNGKAVHLFPCNLFPFSRFTGNGYVIDQYSEYDFDILVRNFEYYNCTGRETGYYAAFYIDL